MLRAFYSDYCRSSLPSGSAEAQVVGGDDYAALRQDGVYAPDGWFISKVSLVPLGQGVFL